jgi:hypothetical protein
VLIEVPSSPTQTPLHDDFQKYGSVVPLVHSLSLFIMVSYVLFLTLMIVLTIQNLSFIIMRFLFSLFYRSHHSSFWHPTPISILFPFIFPSPIPKLTDSQYLLPLPALSLIVITTIYYSTLYPYP